MPRKSGGAKGSKRRPAQRAPRVRLLFSDQEKCRDTLGRMIRRFDTDRRADVPRFRALCYAVRTMSDLLRRGSEEDLLARLGAVEQRLGLVRKDGTIIPIGRRAAP